MTDIPQLAQRLRELRRRSGLTQERFAEKAGLSYKFYQQIETGRKKQIWLETVERIAAGFGLEVWELLGPQPAETLIAAEPPQAPFGRPKPTKTSAESEKTPPSRAD